MWFVKFFGKFPNQVGQRVLLLKVFYASISRMVGWLVGLTSLFRVKGDQFWQFFERCFLSDSAICHCHRYAVFCGLLLLVVDFYNRVRNSKNYVSFTVQSTQMNSYQV